MTLFEIINELDKNEDIHLARIIIILNQFSSQDKMIDGMTKLAKLDFFLRYPTYLERAITVKGKSAKNIQVREFEQSSIESKMVRYKYGPWDFRYRKFINVLIGKGLARYNVEGKTINIGLTSKGVELANHLSTKEPFYDITNRASIIYKNFNNSGSYLKDFIYKHFPEIVSLQMRTEIE